jgi:hypothetical protein
MEAALHAAYCATRYRYASAEGELLLTVGIANTALASLLRHRSMHSAAVLTAFNPGSVQQDPDWNLLAQSALQNELQTLGLECIPGLHEDPTGSWPAEAGLLVPGMDRIEAHAIAARYGQLAFLWCDATAIPQLIETTASPPRP